MPEITSVENIRAKLRQFDERIEGAIAAADTLARVRDDAQALLVNVDDVLARSEQSLQKAEAIRLQLQQVQHEWTRLKQEVEKIPGEAREALGVALSKVDSAQQRLAKQLAEAEQRLSESTRAALAEHAEALRQLEHSTRENAAVADGAKTTVVDKADQVEQLLSTLRDELHEEIRAKMAHAEELLASQFEEAQKRLSEQINAQINAFRVEMKQQIEEHQHSMDRQLTDFLNKQNAMVQNLVQQIDSYQRATQALAMNLSDAKKQVTANQRVVEELCTDASKHQDELKQLSTRLEEALARRKGKLGWLFGSGER